MKSPLGQLVQDPLASLLHMDQCPRGANGYDKESKTDLPARKATHLLWYDINLPTIIKTCPCKSTHMKHADLRSGKSGYLAVYPRKMAVSLTQDFAAHAKLVCGNMSALTSLTFDTYWKCMRCRVGKKTLISRTHTSKDADLART